jgi:Bacterial regulatory helix-turn-helix protein, lysR family
MVFAHLGLFLRGLLSCKAPEAAGANSFDRAERAASGRGRSRNGVMTPDTGGMSRGPDCRTPDQVSALEDHLGTRLVQRSTQAVTLTEEGRELLVAAQQLVDSAEALRQMTANRRGKPMGPCPARRPGAARAAPQ